MGKPETPSNAGGIPRYISVAEFMERTTLSRPTVSRRIKAGLIRPVVKDGRRVLIGIDALHSLGGCDGKA